MRPLIVVSFARGGASPCRRRKANHFLFEAIELCFDPYAQLIDLVLYRLALRRDYRTPNKLLWHFQEVLKEVDGVRDIALIGSQYQLYIWMLYETCNVIAVKSHAFGPRILPVRSVPRFHSKSSLRSVPLVLNGRNKELQNPSVGRNVFSAVNMSLNSKLSCLLNLSSGKQEYRNRTDGNSQKACPIPCADQWRFPYLTKIIRAKWRYLSRGQEGHHQSDSDYCSDCSRTVIEPVAALFGHAFSALGHCQMRSSDPRAAA